MTTDATPPKANVDLPPGPADPILQFFAYDHLPPGLQPYSKPFCDLALDRRHPAPQPHGTDARARRRR